LRPRAPRQKGA
jgi:hypothetical protein